MKRIKVFNKRIIPITYYKKMSNIKNYLKLLILFGFKYKCIFRKGHFRKLLPIGLKSDVAMNLIGGDIVMLYVLDVIQQTGRD